MKKYIKGIQILFLFAVLLSLTAYSQEETLISPYIQLQYFKNTDNRGSLKTTLTWSKDRVELPLPGMEVSFFTGSGKKRLLASAITDEKGVASFILEESLLLPVDNDGLWSFSTEYKGNDTIEAATAELAVKDVVLEMTLLLVDTIKTINLNAYTLENGKKIPVSGEALTVYVPRMFSMLPVAEVTFDETGAASVEFPPDLPGDKDGNLTIIAMFVEHPAFGNVEKRTTEKWGIPTNFSIPVTHRALWTKTAPMWMIITLSVLLTGVWGHYMFAVISLILIRMDAKRKKAKDEYRL